MWYKKIISQICDSTIRYGFYLFVVWLLTFTHPHTRSIDVCIRYGKPARFNARRTRMIVVRSCVKTKKRKSVKSIGTFFAALRV